MKAQAWLGTVFSKMELILTLTKKRYPTRETLLTIELGIQGYLY